jgi:2-oxo-3-hexenedioate decarboxylase
VPISDNQVEALADRVLAALDTASSISPLTGEPTPLELDDAYRVAAAVAGRRIARGERPVGWKIGFTNRTIWEEYGVHAPIWGLMYDTTVEAVDDPATPAPCSLARMVEPRIEPEIVFRIAAVPHPEMSDEELLACIDAVGHGFEMVHSIFPGWRFKPADTVAALALHGCLVHGPLVSLDTADRTDWLERLSSFEITLLRDGAEVDRGIAANVLGGPVPALRHLLRGLVDDPHGRGLEAGDLVTTGTVTRAFPVQPGERWSTRITGLPVPGLAIYFS